MVTAGLQEALQPALEARRTWPPLAQGEDASRMIAGAVQQLVESAGARLLAAAVGQGLRDHPGRQQGGRWQQEQQQQQRHGGPGDLGRWRPGLRGLPGAPASSPYTQAFFSWLRSPSRPAPPPPHLLSFRFPVSAAMFREGLSWRTVHVAPLPAHPSSPSTAFPPGSPLRLPGNMTLFWVPLVCCIPIRVFTTPPENKCV